MKKLSSKCISCLMIVVMLFTGVFGIDAFATTAVEDHFGKLNYYFGEEKIKTPPSENTCPYVAMSLLLTFYDTYWNERFVEDKYEWQKGTYDSSARSLTETFAATAEAADWEDYVEDNVPEEENNRRYEYYPEYAQNHFETTNVFLEPYLISVGVELEFHNDVYDDVNNDGGNNEEKPTLGLNDEETVDVLERYLYVKRGFKSDQVTVNYLHENEGNIVTKMKEIIESGFPVIYIGKMIVNETVSEGSDNDEKKKEGHELIAYGIEEKEDGTFDILLHTGWRYDNYRKYNTVEYNINRAIIWLEINEENLPHQCSNNYYDVAEDRYMCACNIYFDSHTSHNHYYLSEYRHNNAHHYKECICGSITELTGHNLDYLGSTSTVHIERCMDCDYLKAVAHEYETFTYNSSAHIGTCVCGYVSEEIPHSRGYCRKSDYFYHTIYCECGFVLGTERHEWVRSGLFYVCNSCGLKKSIGEDGPILMKIDDEKEKK